MIVIIIGLLNFLAKLKWSFKNESGLDQQEIKERVVVLIKIHFKLLGGK